MSKKAKIVFLEKITCPYCKKRIIIKKTKTIMTPATPAEYEEITIAEKDSQTTLKNAKKQ